MSLPEDIVVVRCVAFPSRSEGKPGYLAQCIDLDLAVWRPTLEQAKEQLEEQIIGYAETIESEEEFNQLIPRQAPLIPDRARYHMIAFSFALPKIWQRFSASMFDQRIPRTRNPQGVGI